MGIGSLGSCDVMFEKQNYLLQGALYETGGAPDFHSGINTYFPSRVCLLITSFPICRDG